MSNYTLPNHSNNNKRLRVSKYTCDICNYFCEKYKELSNHKRIHQTEGSQTLSIDLPIQDVSTVDEEPTYSDVEESDTDIGLDPSEDSTVTDIRKFFFFFFFGPIKYSHNVKSVKVSAQENIDASYKTSCHFEEEEGLAHVYNQRNIDTSNFTTADLLSIHLYDLILESNVPRECYRKIVRFVNTVIRDHQKLLQGRFINWFIITMDLLFFLKNHLIQSLSTVQLLKLF